MTSMPKISSRKAMTTNTAFVCVLTKLFAIAECFERTYNIYAAIGKTITLKCLLLSQNLSAQWVNVGSQVVLFDGLQINPIINNGTSNPKFEITGNYDIGEYNLKINEVDIQDIGVYKCDTEINGKPQSKFFTIVIEEYQSNNDSDEDTTVINYLISEGFSIYKWIMIFLLTVLCIFILPLVAAGVLKVIRSNHERNGLDTDIERAPEFLYETINDTGIIRAPLSVSPRSNITNSRPSEHSLESERSVALYTDSNNQQSRYIATQLSVHIPNIFFYNNADSDTSSTQSLGLVYEPPYINHYQPLVRGLRLLNSSIYYDDGSTDISLC